MKHYSETELGRARYDVSIKKNRVEKTVTLLEKQIKEYKEAEAVLQELETQEDHSWLSLVEEN